MEDFTKLKNQILDDLISITDEEGVEPSERFELIITRYINSEDTSLLSRAYEAAQQIEDVSARGTALMQILEEINILQAEQSATENASPQINSEIAQQDDQQ